MATKCAINGRQWGAYDGRRQNLGKISELLKLGITAVSFITALNSLS
ncbi:hypothetical protein [Rhodococcus sp. YL-1]|nr:hypothetical protein [Rhodococcus sp. YL-1]